MHEISRRLGLFCKRPFTQQPYWREIACRRRCNYKCMRVELNLVWYSLFSEATCSWAAFFFYPFWPEWNRTLTSSIGNALTQLLLAKMTAVGKKNVLNRWNEFLLSAFDIFKFSTTYSRKIIVHTFLNKKYRRWLSAVLLSLVQARTFHC